MAISVKNLNFFYGSSQALFDINLDAQEGDTVVLLGPSGAGTVSYTQLTLPTIA